LLVAVSGLGAVVVIDMLSFLGVAIAVTFLRTDTDPITPEDDTDRDPHPVRTGLRAIADRPVLRGLLSINAFGQIAQGGFVVLFVVFVVDRLGGDGTDVGLIRGTMAIGAVVGATVITRVATGIEPLRLASLGYVGMGLVSLVFWNAPLVTETLWVYVALFALSGVPGSALAVGIMTTVQTASPPAVLGRVAGVLRSSESMGTAVGSIIAGVLVDSIPLTSLLDAQSLVYVTCGLLTWRLARAHSVSGSTASDGPRLTAAE
jgi:predicted MFS family arabinose efflux permease